MRRVVRAGARLFYRARGYVPTRIDGATLRVDPYHIGFWRDVATGGWEPEAFAFLNQHLGPESAFLDVGAWIGPITLAAAHRCARVYCFEPDREAYRFLLWNLDLNRCANVTPFHAALGARTGVRTLSGREGAFGTSRSSLLPSPGTPETRVFSWGWAEWLDLVQPGHLDCIKIDVEGSEFELLPVMAEYLRRERPALHLSLHPSFLPESERQDKLAVALEALRHYKTVRDEGGNEVSLEEVKRLSLAGNCAFVMTD